MRVIVMVGIAAASIAAGGAAQAQVVFDQGSRVGSAVLVDGAVNHRYAAALTTNPANSLRAQCSDDGNTWIAQTQALPVGTLAYAGSGAYPVLDVQANTAINEIFLIAYNPASMRDEIQRFYVDAAAQCALQPSGSIPPPIEVKRLGPRLAIALDAAMSPSAWVFTVVPTSPGLDVGHLLAVEVKNYGTGAVQPWIDVSQALGNGVPTFDPSFTPIAAVRSEAFNRPLVAVRKDSTHVAVVVRNNMAPQWIEVDSPVIPNANLGNTIGNSIAIAATPQQVGVGSVFYEWILVAGTDGNLYATHLGKTNNFFLSQWFLVGAPPNETVDAATDSVAASFSADTTSTISQSVYVRGFDSAANVFNEWSVELSAFDASPIYPWLKTTVSGTGWLATDAFRGQQTVLRIVDPATGNATHETYGHVFEDPGGPTTVGRMRHTPWSTLVGWVFTN